VTLQRGGEETWKDRVGKLLTEVRALYLAARDPRTPLAAKLVALFVASYCASPIQLIPNWIPGIGYADDLVVAILGLRLARRLIPPALLEEYVRRAQAMDSSGPSAAVALTVLGLFGLVIALALWTILHFLRS